MKLSLNLPAVERLLAGESELEVELREQIAEQFADKHIKSLFNSARFQTVIERIENVVREEARKTFEPAIGRFEYYTTTATLSPAFRAKLDKSMSEILDKEVNRIVGSAFEKFRTSLEDREKYWADYADRAIKEKIDKTIELRVSEGVAARLAAIKNGL